MLTAEPTRTHDTAARILAAAEALFLRRNYADVTVDQVAAAAGLTKGAVYHHFLSKEQLYLAMLHHDLAEKRTLWRRMAVDFAGSVAERLRRLTRAFLELPEGKRRLIGLVRRDINIFPDPIRADLVRAYQQALPGQVEQILRDGIRNGEIVPCDPRLLSWQFVAFVEMLLTPYAEGRFACDEDRLNYVMSLFMSGCARTPRGAST